MADEIESIEQKDASNEDAQSIFEQQFHELTNEFGKKCEKMGVQTAIMVAMLPKPEDATEEDAEAFSHPVVFYKGNILEAMSMSAEVLREFKSNVMTSLDTNPRR